ncbi:septum formation family protein [Nocardiopsis alborubida]|uniref:Septum formation family protein n=1 Tax=Nocardiopsis alborubida TaxID=146802 RepID=A0A7X6MJ34_9ACTN|nr:septum formation family protein [Nocardiopsis alborubida]NKZ01850.1 septum formation family protein [Nocardiopsis alborubida]
MSNFSPILRTAGISVLAAGSVFALSGCGALMSVMGAGNVMDLNVGECFVEEEMNAALVSGEVSNIPLVDCAEEHDSEFFFAYDMTEGEYPGVEATESQAEELCTGENFTNFIGVSYAESEIYAGHIYPTQETWDQFNDREIICYATTSFSGEMVTGTLEGANR